MPNSISIFRCQPEPWIQPQRASGRVWFHWLPALFLALILAPPLHAQAQAMHRGQGVLDWEWNGRTIPLHYYLPNNARRGAPVLIALHGMSRDAAGMLRTWTPLAEEHGVLVVAPEFSDQEFPRSASYNTGNVGRGGGRVNPREDWTFSAIEPMFDFIREASGNTSETYFLYGHSAGAQFAHRFLFLIPDNRAARAVLANAGWYTLPDLREPWPAGLADTGVRNTHLAAALSKPALLLLGEEDNDPEHPQLSRSDTAMALGEHRLERGENFLEFCETAARRAGADFAWGIQHVPEVGHSNRNMSPAAAEWLFGGKRNR